MVLSVLIIAAILGASVGSFLTLITYRLPRDEKIGMTRSRCPACQNTLRVRDLFPILSWVMTRGRCGQCGTKVSARYPLTELACAGAALSAVMGYGLSWQALALAGLLWSIVAIIVTDLEHTIILDEVQIAVGVFGALWGWANGTAAEDMLAGAVTGAAIGLSLKYGFLYFRNKDGLGMGDVKFLAVAGIWLADAANFVPFLFFSGLLGIASGLTWKALGLGERFPFGPALALALLLCVVKPDTANGFWQLYGLLGVR
jgi:leader peptidase (prepilin peptidase)/N-methyltransferase